MLLKGFDFLIIKSFCILETFAPPVMMRIASSWIFSKCRLSSDVQVSQIIPNYSKSGSTQLQYIFWIDDLSRSNLYFRRMQINSMCIHHKRSSDIIRPICLWCCTSSICVGSIYNLGNGISCRFLILIKYLVFVSWNSTSLIFVHRDIVSRSKCRRATNNWRWSNIEKRLISSSNNLIQLTFHFNFADSEIFAFAVCTSFYLMDLKEIL